MSKSIIEMAKEAGDDWDSTLLKDKEFLERFAELVRADAIAAEREACANLVWEMKGQCWAYDYATDLPPLYEQGGTHD